MNSPKAGQSPDVVWHHATVTRRNRERLNGHKGAVVWLTGLSGAGKSTVAHAVEQYLHDRRCRTYVLDGDNIRHGLCGDLGFSIEDRHENIRRVGEVVKLFADAGVIVLAAFISPLRVDRRWVRDQVGQDSFVEIYCRCPIGICETRDLKGLYQKARRGEISDFTGISSPYEEPESPDVELDSSTLTIAESVEAVIRRLRSCSIID